MLSTNGQSYFNTNAYPSLPDRLSRRARALKKPVVVIHNTYASPDYAPFARRISLTLRLGVEVTLRPNFAGAKLIEKRGGPFHCRLVENLAFLGAGPHRIALDAG